MLLPRLTTTATTTAVVTLLLLGLTACQNPQANPPKPPPPAKYSATYDKEVNHVMQLANQDRWEDWRLSVSVLQRMDDMLRR